MSRPEPVRVLHLRDSPWIDGPGRTILETATHIDRDRVDYQVGVFVRTTAGDHPLVRALRERGLPVHEIADDGSSIGAVARRVAGKLRVLGSQILHASELRSGIAALLSHRPSGTRLARTAHGWIANDLRGRLRQWLDLASLRRFDQVIVVSEATRRRIPGWWIPAARVRVLHNAIVAANFVRSGRRRPSVPIAASDDVTLLCVGRLSPEKGQALLLQAVAQLVAHYPKLRLVIAGRGPMEESLRRQARDLGVENNVNFEGYLADMSGVYDSADLVVQSSFTEGLPNVILEAAYLGVPIVATDVGGTSEVIQHDVSGWLIRPRRKDEIVAGILAYLRNPARFLALARAAQAKIEADFSFAARTSAQMALYEELAGRTRPAAGAG